MKKLLILFLFFPSLSYCIQTNQEQVNIDSLLIGKKLSLAIKSLNIDTNFTFLYHAHRIYGIEITDDTNKIRIIVNGVLYLSEINPKNHDSKNKRRHEKLELIKDEKIICISLINGEQNKTFGDCD